MTERELTTEKAAIAQQPVISIRISEALRLKLEGLKVLMSMKSGEPVSTSEAAKQLLESSKEERLELVSLLTEPTDSLLMIRRKADSKLPLSQAEWTAVAYFCTEWRDLPTPHRRRFHMNLLPESLRHSRRFTVCFANQTRPTWTLSSSHISRPIGKPKRRNRKRSEATMFGAPSPAPFGC